MTATSTGKGKPIKRQRGIALSTVFVVLLAFLMIRGREAQSPLSFSVAEVSHGASGMLTVSNQCRLPIQLAGYAILEMSDGTKTNVPVTAYLIEPNHKEALNFATPVNGSWRISLPVAFYDWKLKLQYRISQWTFLPPAMRSVHIGQTPELQSEWFHQQ